MWDVLYLCTFLEEGNLLFIHDRKGSSFRKGISFKTRYKGNLIFTQYAGADLGFKKGGESPPPPPLHTHSKHTHATPHHTLKRDTIRAIFKVHPTERPI